MSTALTLLQASVDLQDESEFRMLVDNQHVKYITIDGGLYSVDDMCFEPILTKILPPFPSGDWNIGRVSRDPATGKPHFASVSKEKLDEIQTAWHPKRIDHLQLGGAQKLRSNVNQVTCPGFDTPVVAKFARFEWEIPQLEAETEAYGWIQNHRGIAPEFLGHLTEDGRVIGFLIASMSDCRHATPDDLALCRDVLGELHKLGIKHGDVNKHNFLIQDNGEGKERATLIDFDMATRNATKEERDAEMDGLQAALEDTSGRGGSVITVDDATWKSHEMDEVERLQGWINDAAVSNIVLELTGKECTIQHFNYDGGMMGCANYHARVSFSDGSTPWLLRVPRVSRVSTSLPRPFIDKLIRSEFATLKFLENLPIPTARAFAYGVTDNDHGVGVSFILMEELPGKPWPGAMADAGSQHSVKIWQQLTETMAEIQKHPFPMAGSLMPDGASSVKVSAMVTDRFFMLSPNGPFTTAIDYYTAYAEQYLQLIADGQAYTAYPVNAYLLYSFLKDKANEVAADEEPTFFLKHIDDKADHLLVDEHFNITGIIDWQGARVVPRREAFGYSLVSADMGLLCNGKAGLSASDAAFAAASRSAAIRGVGDDDKVRRYIWGLGSEAEWKYALPLAERLLEIFGVEMSWAEWKQEAVTAHYAGDARLRALLENVESKGNN